MNGHHQVDGVGENYIEDPYRQSLENEAEYTSEMGVSDDQCREVRCIEMEEPEAGRKFQLHASAAEGNGHIVDNGSTGRSSHQNGFLYGSLEQRIQEVQRSIDSLMSPEPENTSSWDDVADASSSKSSLNFKSQNLKANFANGESFPSSNEEYSEKTPPSDVETDFSGRPGGVKKFDVIGYDVNAGSLSRNGSQSSVGTEVVDDVRSQSGKNIADEEITSVQTFVAGLKDAKLQYEKQLEDSKVSISPFSVASRMSCVMQNAFCLLFLQKNSRSFKYWHHDITCQIRNVET